MREIEEMEFKPPRKPEEMEPIEPEPAVSQWLWIPIVLIIALILLNLFWEEVLRLGVYSVISVLLFGLFILLNFLKIIKKKM